MLTINKDDHQNNIEKAILEYDGDGKIIFFSGSEKVIVSKSILMMFSPVVRSLVSSLPCCSSPSIIIPNFSPAVVHHFVQILESGYTTGVPNDSFKQVYEIIELAKILDIDISDLRRDMLVNLPKKVLHDKKKGF